MASAPISSLERQYRLHEAALRHYLMKQLRDAELADDLLQETFLRACKAKTDVVWADMEDARAYLFAIARNLSIDHFRRKRVRNESETEFDELQQSYQASSRSDEEGRLEARDDLRRLALAIKELPKRAQQAFILNRIYRYSYAEVGKKMGISPRTVENHVARAFEFCATKLGDAGKGSADPANVINISAHHRKTQE